MAIRKFIFWCHLLCGVTAGVVILMMSVTGVLLTYERQMVAWADRSALPPVSVQAQRLPLDQIINSVREHEPEAWPFPVTVYADAEQPLSVALGRGLVLYLDPYTGAVLGEGAKGIRAFFSLVLQWHRWFNITGDGRDTARAITGASNLMFLFLVLSGMYLWLPRTWKWVMFRVRLTFNPENNSSKARDFNWHHVFGIWSSIPLAIVVATATVFSYPWASNSVYRVFGEQPPARGGPPGATLRTDNANRVSADQTDVQGSNTLPVEQLFNTASAKREDWNMITIRFSARASDPVVFSIDRGDGGQPHRQASLSLDARSGEVVRFESFADQSAGRQARALIRRLHTGEALGITGQTIAGLVSFAGIILVWTGLALAYRRLLQPLFRKRRDNVLPYPPDMY